MSVEQSLDTDGEVPQRLRQSRLARVRDHVINGIPSVCLLAAFTLIAPFLPWVDRADAVALREVMRVRAALGWDGVVAPSAADRAVHLLEVVPESKLNDLEQAGPLADATIKRIGSVRPIDRGAMGELLRRVARRLADAPPQPRRVVAIDVDLAPIEKIDGSPAAAAKEEADAKSVREALLELRRHAHVVAIALDRGSADERARRNDFMAGEGSAGVECTGRTDTAIDAKGGGLFFASPRLFLRSGEYPVQFLHERRADAGVDPVAAGRAAIYPSLGTLMHLLAAAPPRDRSEREALTLLCEQARTESRQRQDKPARGPAVAFLEDRIAGDGADADSMRAWTDAYRSSYFNWTLLESNWIRATNVYAPDSIGPCSAAGGAKDDAACRERPAAAKPAASTRLDDDWFHAPMLVLAVDGGPGSDKFGSASPSGDMISGATLHALQAATLQKPLNEWPLVGLIANLVCGLLFLSLWAAFATLAPPLRQRLPTLMRWVSSVVSFLLAGLLGWLALRAVAGTIGWGVWFNPALILIGLALEAEPEKWGAPAGDEDAPSSWRRRLGHALTFGAIHLYRISRPGFGPIHTSVRMSLHSTHSQFEVSAESIQPGLGIARYTDLLLAAILRWALLLAGIAALCWQMWFH